MMLISENAPLPPPKQVAFVHKHWVSSSESSNSKERQLNSHNNVTLTDIEGRWACGDVIITHWVNSCNSMCIRCWTEVAFYLFSDSMHVYKSV